MTDLDAILSEYNVDTPLAEASTLPAPWYTDKRVAELERRAVFGNSWQLVGRVDQLREVGAFITAVVANEPIVVVRGPDMTLRAFFNVCRHHAAAVVTECAGRADRLRCPYHGWTYGLDGALKSPTEWGGVENFDPADNGLVPLSVATWEHMVFVHLDPHPPAIEDWLGAHFMDAVAQLNLGDLTWVARREWTIQCNWKVFVDNYLDGGYHVPFLHRGLNSILSYKDYTIDCFDRVCLQQSPIDTSVGEAMTASVRHGHAYYWWLYPNLMLNWYEGYLDTNLVIPLGVDRMKVIFDFWFADPAQVERNEASIAVSDRIQDEDHAICEAVQRGLGSRAYRAGRLSVRREAGEHLFHRLLAADVRGAARRG
ncbi:MAG TPA: aromatic ring-hydroxylating dioxygenase subunit alpha [Nannocystaceae bacterium]|nr:aromatic ring-hydroxylating dioxygenase subunit alpha [Nannocystaceae bacterium]